MRYLILVGAASSVLALGCGDDAERGDPEGGRDAATSTLAGMDGGAVRDASASGAGGAGGSEGAAGTAGASIDTRTQPFACSPAYARSRSAGWVSTVLKECGGCYALGCCEEINACDAVTDRREGCSGIEAHISQCLSRQGIAPDAATSTEIEACLDEPNRLSRWIAENAELAPALVALFECFRRVPSATCYRAYFDGGMPVPETFACDANTEDDAGAPPQTCIEQCREEWPEFYLCLPDDPAPGVCDL